jgi:hypothetical protein
MRRRDFITLVSGVTAVWPVTARAQQTDCPLRRNDIWLLPLLGEPVVFLDPFLSFRLGMELTEVARNGFRPRDFYAPILSLPDRRQHYGTQLNPHPWSEQCAVASTRPPST